MFCRHFEYAARAKYFYFIFKLTQSICADAKFKTLYIMSCQRLHTRNVCTTRNRKVSCHFLENFSRSCITCSGKPKYIFRQKLFLPNTLKQRKKGLLYSFTLTIIIIKENNRKFKHKILLLVSCCANRLGVFIIN